MVERYEEWDQWKKTIGQAVSLGERVGLNEETIVKIGSKIGDFLDKMSEPENREQRLLKELWDVASEEEQLALARMFVKLIQGEKELEYSTIK